MMDALAFHDLVVVNSRFTRSVSLARDAHRLDALQGYILTPTGRDVLQRMADALREESGTRAWSLTGPYGSGKSAFALFCAHLLGGDSRPRLQARSLLEEADPALADRFFGQGAKLSKKSACLCPVLVTGARQPLAKALAASLAFSLRGIAGRGRPPQLIERLEALAAKPDPPSASVVSCFEEANDFLSRFGCEGAGLLLIVDELGKFLEYGASNPDRGDVFVLQELAEAATRSSRPFLFLTILHQALDRYADHISPSRRAEWAKVQGRFEDVAFEERTESIHNPKACRV